MTKTIHRLPVASLKPNPSNPRTIRKEKLAKLVQSLRDFPAMLELRPIVVTSLEDPVVLGGNMRLQALKQLGVAEVPVLEAAELTPAQRDEFVIKDNVGFGDWDWDALANDWDPVELEQWGLDLPDLTAADLQVTDDADDMPEVPSDPLTKPGDLWILGEHRLLCGDSTQRDAVEYLLNGKKIDLLLTDPPYGVSYTGGTKDKLKIENDDLKEPELKNLIEGCFDLVEKNSRPGAYWYATVPPGPLHLLFAMDWKERGILRQIMVWAKDQMVLGHSEYHYQHEPILFGWTKGERKKNKDRTRTTLWQYARPKANREHPTMKPLELWSQAVNDGSNKKDLVYDPFLGSGTTLVVCEQLGRTCYGMELDPKYCDVIVARWEKLTGQQAVRSYNLNDQDREN